MNMGQLSRRGLLGLAAAATAGGVVGRSTGVAGASPRPARFVGSCDDSYRQGPNYVHPTVTEPVVDGVRLLVPDCLGNQRLAALGLVDVTAAPFHADKTGTQDATAALQEAINFARDYQMVTYFPYGSYLVSDTLNCDQGAYLPLGGNPDKPASAPNFPCVLVGERRADRKRPTIKLAPNAPGFANPAQTKRVVNLWHRWADSWAGPPQPEKELAASAYNQMLLNLDISIGAGNAGAVAVYCRGAQGCSVQECTIDATHGHTGLAGGAGSGGSHHGITVIGGRIGLDLRSAQPCPTISDVTLIDQSEAAIRCDGLGLTSSPYTLVGVRIRSATLGPVIVAGTSDPQPLPNSGPLALVDSEIRFTGSPHRDTVAITSNRAVSLTNVYLRGAATILQHADGTRLSALNAGRGWTHVREYAHSGPPVSFRGDAFTYPIYLDGARHGTTLVDLGRRGPSNVQARHRLPDLPGWEAPGVVNVREAPYNARGDGRADDTAAIQRALDDHKVVFLPKGYYRVTRPITLRADNVLIGVAQHLSTLLITDELGTAAAPQPILQTVDDADARTILAFCGNQIAIPADRQASGTYALRWRAGRRSVVRSTMFRPANLGGQSYGTDAAATTPPRIVVTGSGGGRWYNLQQANTATGAGYRHLLIAGTTQPLTLYQCNVEHGRGDAQAEITGSAHVTIYGLKSESPSPGLDKPVPVLWIRDSDQIRVFGYGGNAKPLAGVDDFGRDQSKVEPSQGGTLFRVERTPNFRVAATTAQPVGSGEFDYPTKWAMLSEQLADGTKIVTAPLERPVLYRRGDPS